MRQSEWLKSKQLNKNYPEYVMELTTQMKIKTPLKEPSSFSAN